MESSYLYFVVVISTGHIPWCIHCLAMWLPKRKSLASNKLHTAHFGGLTSVGSVIIIKQTYLQHFTACPQGPSPALSLQGTARSSFFFLDRNPGAEGPHLWHCPTGLDMADRAKGCNMVQQWSQTSRRDGPCQEQQKLVWRQGYNTTPRSSQESSYQ